MKREETGERVIWRTRSYPVAFVHSGASLHLGRQLRIEYQERTPDGSYRHPRWDRWENE